MAVIHPGGDMISGRSIDSFVLSWATGPRAADSGLSANPLAEAMAAVDGGSAAVDGAGHAAMQQNAAVEELHASQLAVRPEPAANSPG